MFRICMVIDKDRYFLQTNFVIKHLKENFLFNLANKQKNIGGIYEKK